MKRISIIVALSFIGFFFNGCKKVEGEGGSSTIKGKIYEKKYNSVGGVIAEYNAADERVYIIYGEGSTFYNDDIRTSYDGSFEFNYLQPGKYTIFVYEDCNTCPSGVKEVIVNTEITGKKSVVDLGTIEIKNQ